MKRAFLIVLDSMGIGELPDACDYNDEGSNTFKSCFNTGHLNVPNLQKLGIFNIEGIDFGERSKKPLGCFARMAESSKGKDTTTGHWEIAGLITDTPMPTFPNGFLEDIIKEFEKKCGRKTLCNKPFSGTEVLKKFGEESIKNGDLIVYTSADSVFQIAAHEEIVPPEKLYEYCKIARKILDDYKESNCAVGRVIARPFIGNFPDFVRTSNRRDFSLNPPSKTMLDILKEAGKDVISVGKIYDIFNGRGITKKIKTKNNSEGMAAAIAQVDEKFNGLCFVNLVDFDMLYGHRNDVLGYTAALNNFDAELGNLLDKLNKDDILIITADHGCDPTTSSTDHSREYVPMIAFGKNFKNSIDLGTRSTFSDISQTILEYLLNNNSDNFSIDLKKNSYSDIIKKLHGESFLDKIAK